MFRYAVALIFSALMTAVIIVLYVNNGQQWDNFILWFVPFGCSMIGFSVVIEWPGATPWDRLGPILTCGTLSWIAVRIAEVFLAPAPGLALIY